MTLLALVVAVTAGAQTEDPIVFPFNPDANYDGILGVDDLLAMLSGFGEEVALPDFTEWATGAMFNLLNYEAALAGESDSLANVWEELAHAQNELDSLQANIDIVVDDAILEHVQTYCAYFPVGGPVKYLDEGCRLVMLWAYDFNEYGGTLRLTHDGREAGDLLTIVYSRNNGNAGSWLIQSISPNGYIYLDSVSPSGGTNWLGQSTIWTKSFVWDGDVWSAI